MEEQIFRRQAKIKTEGVNRTTPNMGRKPTDIKIPKFGFTGYRDPRSFDLVDIETAQDKLNEEIQELSEKAEQEIQAKKTSRKQAEIDAAVKEALEKKEKEVKPE